MLRVGLKAIAHGMEALCTTAKSISVAWPEFNKEVICLDYFGC